MTTISQFFHWDQIRCAASQNNLSKAFNFGLGWRRLNTASRCGEGQRLTRAHGQSSSTFEANYSRTQHQLVRTKIQTD
jgi:hypothetical protein